MVATAAGFGTLTFTDANNGTFRYTVGAITQTKAITRQAFGPLPTCSFGAQPNLALATNYQDLWWKTPAASESGWGINLNHEGDTIFGTWFTYDLSGLPLWLVVTPPDGPEHIQWRSVSDLGRAFRCIQSRRRCSDEGRHCHLHVRQRQQRDVYLYCPTRRYGESGHAVEVNHARSLHRARDDVQLEEPRTQTVGLQSRQGRAAVAAHRGDAIAW